MLEKMIHVSVKNLPALIHWHDMLEVNLVLRGTMTVTRNNREFAVESGELMVVNRDDVHAVSSSSEDLLYVQLHMNLELFNQYLPDIWTEMFYCTPEHNDLFSQNLKAEIKSHMSSIVSMMNESTYHIDLDNQIVLHCLEILSCLRMGFPAMGAEGKKLSTEQKNRIWKAIDYIYDHCKRKLPVQEVAEHVYISSDYLTRLLKKQMTSSSTPPTKCKFAVLKSRRNGQKSSRNPFQRTSEYLCVPRNDLY